MILGFEFGIREDVSGGRTESATESGEAGERLFVSVAEAGFVLPVAVERAAVIVEMFLGESFLERAGDAGGGVVADEVLFVDPKATETPSGVGHFFDAEGFHVILGFVVVDEGGEDLLEGVLVFRGETGGVSGEVDGEGVEDGLRVAGAFGLSAVAAGGFDLGGRGVTRHSWVLDHEVSMGDGCVERCSTGELLGNQWVRGGIFCSKGCERTSSPPRFPARK